MVELATTEEPRGQATFCQTEGSPQALHLLTDDLYLLSAPSKGHRARLVARQKAETGL